MNYAGIELAEPREGELALGAVVLMKVIDAEGNLNYREWKSADLHWVEGLGMLDTARDTFKQVIMNGMRPGGQRP